jgi:hypothetical protein
MKNKLYSRIVICGLLSSSFALLGMETEGNAGALAKSSDGQKENLLGVIEHKVVDALHLGKRSGHTSPAQLSPRNATGDASALTPKTGKVKREKSSSTNDSSNAAAHRHGHHFKETAKDLLHKVEKDVVTIEHLIAKYGTVVLQDIINNPAIITEILTTVGVNPAQAQSITSMIEAGASKAEVVVTDFDALIKNALAQQAAEKQAVKQEAATQRAAALTAAIQSQKTRFQEMESAVADPIIGLLDFINNHPSIVQAGLTVMLGSATSAEIMKAEEAIVPELKDGLEKMIQPDTSSTTDASSTQTTDDKKNIAPQTSMFSNSVIGGGVVTFLALLTGILHIKGLLPANMSLFLNNIMQSIPALASATK